MDVTFVCTVIFIPKFSPDKIQKYVNWLYHSPLIRRRQIGHCTDILYTQSHTRLINGYLWATVINDVSAKQIQH